MADLDARIGRLRWRSRRGLKELDKLLEPFFSSDLSHCDATTITTLERLLDCQDLELLDWLLGRATPQDQHLGRMIDRIREGWPRIPG